MLVRARYTWQYYNKNYSFTYMRLHVLLYTGFWLGLFLHHSKMKPAIYIFLSMLLVAVTSLSTRKGNFFEKNCTVWYNLRHVVVFPN